MVGKNICFVFPFSVLCFVLFCFKFCVAKGLAIVSVGEFDRSTKCDVFNVFSLLFGYDFIVTLLFLLSFHI